MIGPTIAPSPRLYRSPSARWRRAPSADADPAVERRLLEPVVFRQDVGERAVGLAARDAGLVVDLSAQPAADARVAAKGVERSRLRATRTCGASVTPAAPGEHLHDRAHGIGSPQRRLRAAHDLHALDLGAGDPAEVELPAISG